MKVKRRTKLAAARRSAFAGGTSIKKTEREFEKDELKHYIRFRYWLPRVKKLIRDRKIKTIRYLSLCDSPALDARLFRREGLIPSIQDKPVPFVYCESKKENFDILQDTFRTSARGFFGKIEEIATDTTNSEYGDFWSTFPLDVINLDFWGDIHIADHEVRNIFRTIQVIISNQSLLRKPYELWITWRAKSSRVANNIQNAYLELIEENQASNLNFERDFSKCFPSILPSQLVVDDLVRIGFIKWILYIANEEFSVVDIDNTEVLVYSRKDKDGKSYRMYNFLVRISPYETITIPSPACEAAKFCKRKYNYNVCLCFAQPRDIDSEYSKLSKSNKKRIKGNLLSLGKEYEKDRSGILK